MQSLLLLRGSFQNSLLREQKSKSEISIAAAAITLQPCPAPQPQEAIERVIKNETLFKKEKEENEMLRQQCRSELEKAGRGAPCSEAAY